MGMKEPKGNPKKVEGTTTSPEENKNNSAIEGAVTKPNPGSGEAEAIEGAITTPKGT